MTTPIDVSAPLGGRRTGIVARIGSRWPTSEGATLEPDTGDATGQTHSTCFVGLNRCLRCLYFRAGPAARETADCAPADLDTGAMECGHLSPNGP